MGKVNFTPAQKAAIENNGGALLIAASAGSGKTRVLVERLLNKIADSEKEYSVTDFLVITYTKAAASELKGKIMDALAGKIAEEPGNRKFRRQYNLCCNADISTIHSFCGNIIRENAHLLGISSDFRVAEESESEIIRRTVLDKVLNERYENINEHPQFQMLADMMSAGRDDGKLADAVLETYGKLLSHPFPAKWAEQQFKMYDMSEITDICETKWGGLLLKECKMTILWWINELKKLIENMSEYEDFSKAYGTSLDETYKSMMRFCNAMGNGWDEAVNNSEILFPRPKPIAGYEDFKDIRNRCKAAVQKISGRFTSKSEELKEDIAAVAPAVKELVSLVLDFEKAYGNEKIRRGIVDYSDLEHYAIKLLVNEQTGEKTALAEQICRKYEEIMVDEYQDVNSVQELIFSAISRENKNVFMVGDVKQSIYRFRLADPTIFLQKYNTFCDAETAEEGEGRKIILANNFRSRKGILSAVNYVFENIMSYEFGEMDYTEREYLYEGKPFPENDEKEIELDVIDMSMVSDEEGDERPERIETEACFAAARIRELIDGKMRVTDESGNLRPVEYGDIAILLRSSKNKAPKYAAALEKLNIPVAMSRGDSFFEAVEINIIMSLLSVIDNPLQDIPLISVLRSPVYNFTADELAVIRMKNKTGYFFEALEASAKDNEKCRSFIKELEDYRSTAPDMPSDKLIWYIYHNTGMLGIIGAMSGGEARVQNLQRLLIYAQKFESAGYKGLFSFILYMRQLMEKGSEPGVEQEESSGNAVKIMSIHKSKGLEFPVVFLADLTKKFNMDDTRKQILIHPVLGIGTKRRDINRKIEYATIARQAIAEKIALETMAEELRVLYVAMTRAQEKLIMVCSYNDWEREKKRLGIKQSLPVSPQLLKNSQNAAEWIMRTALARDEAGVLKEKDVCGGAWDIRLLKGKDYVNIKEICEYESAEDYDVSAELTEKIKNNMDFVYPYSESEDIPSKLTATEMKGLFIDAELSEDAEYISLPAKKIKARRPEFGKRKDKISAAEKGTLMHLVMQHIELARCRSREEIENEVARMAETGVINQEDLENIDLNMLERFFASPIGQRMINAKNCFREFKFSVLVPANEYYSCSSDDEILLQGMVDCCFEESDGFVIVDFKTDNVNESNISERTAVYTGQIKAYNKAISEVMGKRVKETALFFLRTGQTVNVEQI